VIVRRPVVILRRVVGAGLVVVALAALSMTVGRGTTAPEFGTGRVLLAEDRSTDVGADPPDAVQEDGDRTTPTADAVSRPTDEAVAPPFTTTTPRGPVDMATWPASVTIPALDVAAPVRAVGVGSSGELIVPASPMDVGWYQGGAVPGESGVALLTSHVDTRTEGRGVFAGLVGIEPGAAVVLEAADGSEQRWIVIARTQHRKDELPGELFARSGPPRLALVTCGGPFDRERRSYRDNVVVWAELGP